MIARRTFCRTALIWWAPHHCGCALRRALHTMLCDKRVFLPAIGAWLVTRYVIIGPCWPLLIFIIWTAWLLTRCIAIWSAWLLTRCGFVWTLWLFTPAIPSAQRGNKFAALLFYGRTTYHSGVLVCRHTSLIGTIRRAASLMHLRVFDYLHLLLAVPKYIIQTSFRVLEASTSNSYPKHFVPAFWAVNYAPL